MIDEAQATPIAAAKPARSFGSRLMLYEAQAGAAMIAAVALHRSRLMFDQAEYARIAAHAGLSDRSGLVLDQAETAASRAATVLQYLFNRRINLKLVTRLVLDCLLLRVLLLLGARVGLFVLHLLISWMCEPTSSGRERSSALVMSRGSSRMRIMIVLFEMLIVDLFLEFLPILPDVVTYLRVIISLIFVELRIDWRARDASILSEIEQTVALLLFGSSLLL